MGLIPQAQSASEEKSKSKAIKAANSVLPCERSRFVDGFTVFVICFVAVAILLVATWKCSYAP